MSQFKTIRVQLTTSNPNTDNFQIYAVSGSVEDIMTTGTAIGGGTVTPTSSPDYFWTSSILQNGVDFEVFVSASSMKFVSNTEPCSGVFQSVDLLDDCRIYLLYNIWNESTIRGALGLDINQQTGDFCSEIYDLLIGSLGDTPDARLPIILYNAILDNDINTYIDLRDTEFQCGVNNIYRIKENIPNLVIYTGETPPNSIDYSGNLPCSSPGGGTANIINSFNNEEIFIGLSANFGQVVFFQGSEIGTGGNFYTWNANLCPSTP
jgi:hypothetical protein